VAPTCASITPSPLPELKQPSKHGTHNYPERRAVDMTEPLPDLEIYTAATDPPAQQRYNELLIEQFRTNAGKVTGQFADLPVLLRKTIGAKTGATRTTPLVYFKDGDRYLIHLKVRLEQEKLCLLVMIGVRTDGRKELVALADGYRESTESWADLLRDCRRRGMTAPVLAVGDGALGFCAALREVFPQPESSDAGGTSRPTSLPRCPNQHIRVHWQR
jgi:putative transposase